MALAPTPRASQQLSALEIANTQTAQDKIDFDLCENQLRASLERVCHRAAHSPPPLNVTLTATPSIPTFPFVPDPADATRPYPGSRFTTFGRLEAQFLEVADNREPSGRRLDIIAYHHI
jgi:hypothetical protein